MPKLPEYDVQTGVQGAVALQQATPSEFGNSKGWMSFGQGMSDVGKAAADIEERKEHFQSQTQAMVDAGKWDLKLQQMKQDAPPGAPDFAKNLSEEFDNWSTEQIGNVKGGVARQQLQVSYANLKQSLLHDAIKYQADASTKNTMNQLKSGFQMDENAVFASPRKRDDLLLHEINAINASPLDEQNKAILKTQRTNAIWDKALDGSVTSLVTNPLATVDQVQKMITQLEDHKQGWIEDASPHHYQDNLTKLKKFSEVLSKLDQKQQILDFGDWMKHIEKTGVDNGLYTRDWLETNIKDPMQRAKMIKEQEESRAVGQVTNVIKDMPFSKAQQYVQSLSSQYVNTETPGKDLARVQAGERALTQQVQAFNEDPVAFTVDSNPAIKDVYKTLTQNPTPEKAAYYAKMTIAEQERRAPGYPARVLTKQDAAQVSNIMASIPKTPDGAQQAVKTLQSQQQIWGKYWPQVVKDLTDYKAIDGAMSVAAGMFDRPQVAYLAEELVKASMMKESEMAKSIDVAKASSEAQSAATKALGPLRTSLQGLSDGPEIYKNFENAVARVVLYRGFWAGKDKTEDAQDIADKMVNDNYQFSHTQDGFRVPRNEDLNAIIRGTRALEIPSS
jgi:hypothetical protein